MTRGETETMTLKNIFWLGVAISALLTVFIACGPSTSVDEERAPVVGVGCADGVCTLLVHYASYVRVESAQHPQGVHKYMWQDDPGYTTDRRLTYRFPVDAPFVVVLACNLDDYCVEVTEPTQ